MDQSQAKTDGNRSKSAGRTTVSRPIKVAAVALANKIARMAWAMMVREERFKEPRLLPATA
jgi:transposase